MPILTSREAAFALNFTAADQMPEKITRIFLPAVDGYLLTATGKDWGSLTETYTAVDPLSKMVASVILARWYEDPTQIGTITGDGLLGLIAQLHAKSLQEGAT